LRSPEPAILQNDSPLLCDTKEAQKVIPVSRTTLWQLATEGKIKTVHIGRRRFFLYDSLVNFVDGLGTE
jgi:hypothetical protein